MSLEVFTRMDQPTDGLSCDGCGRVLDGGEQYIGGINSCCQGGCYRVLCRLCVEAAARMLGINKT